MQVMEGVALDDGHEVVLKVLKPARSNKIKREIRVLQVDLALRITRPPAFTSLPFPYKLDTKIT